MPVTPLASHTPRAVQTSRPLGAGRGPPRPEGVARGLSGAPRPWPRARAVGRTSSLAACAGRRPHLVPGHRAVAAPMPPISPSRPSAPRRYRSVQPAAGAPVGPDRRDADRKRAASSLTAASSCDRRARIGRVGSARAPAGVPGVPVGVSWPRRPARGLARPSDAGRAGPGGRRSCHLLCAPSALVRVAVRRDGGGVCTLLTRCGVGVLFLPWTVGFVRSQGD
jgi:hypothetical protein